jgi:hypothetical protein
MAKTTRELAEEAFTAIVNAQEALNALRGQAGHDNALVELRVIAGDPMTSLIDELDYDTSSLSRIRNHISAIARHTDKKES